MRPSKSAAAPPASLTSPKFCATKRQRKAAPLGDVTNLLVLAETPTPSKPRRTACRSLPAPSDVSAVSSACSSSASAAPAPKPSAAASVTPARKPSSAACVTPAPKPCSAACVVTPAPAPKPCSAAVIQEERSVVKSPTISTVYRRATETQGRWKNPAAANSKGKEPVAATARCPPLGKSARTNSRKKDTRPISASASCHEGKKKRSIASAPNLLEDLFEKQRAYFADFDAFELVEEDTNLLVIAETPTLSKPRRTARRSLPALSDVSAVSSACSSSASVTPVPKPSGAASVTPARKLSPAACVTPVPKPSSTACVVTPAPKPSSAAVLEEERSVLKSPTISTVHRRTTEAQGRWRRNPAAANSKGKEPVAATARLPPLGKSARTNSRKKDTRPISASAPCHEGKKKRSIASTPNLLEDLLEKQRAYFADFDAFELVEEDTNLLVVAETPTPSKPRRTARRSLPAPSDISAVSSACSSSASVTPAPKHSAAASATPARKPSSAASVTPARKPSSAAWVTPARKPSSAAWVTPAPKPSSAACVVTPAPAPKPSSAAVLEEERSVLKSPTIAKVHRRTTEAQGRERRNPAASNSKGKEPVAAAARCPPLGKSASTNNRKKDTRPISASAPCHEGKKKRPIASTPNLLEDLLEKQRAYFADIDAFELVEEEASESELE